MAHQECSQKFLQKKHGKNILFLDENIPYFKLEGRWGYQEPEYPMLFLKYLGPLDPLAGFFGGGARGHWYDDGSALQDSRCRIFQFLCSIYNIQQETHEIPSTETSNTKVQYRMQTRRMMKSTMYVCMYRYLMRVWLTRVQTDNLRPKSEARNCVQGWWMLGSRGTSWGVMSFLSFCLLKNP